MKNKQRDKEVNRSKKLLQGENYNGRRKNKSVRKEEKRSREYR